MINSHFVVKLRYNRATAILLAIGLASVMSGQVTNPPSVYNSIPNGLLAIPPTQPGNVSSEGPEAYGFKELGDGFTLAPGNRYLTTVSVVLSDWACASGTWFGGNCSTPPDSYTVEPGLTVTTFNQPITLNVYASNGASPPEPGALIATLTKTFQIPYRPSASATCAAVMAPGKWYSAVNNACYNGLATKITFDFTSLAIFLPNQIMVGVTYNTSTAGYNPLGTSTACYSSSGGCPYDSLNISTDGGPVYTAIGTVIDANGIYANYISPAAGKACSSTSPAAAGNSFLLDTSAGCWTGFHPEIQVNASLAPPGAYQLRYAANLSVGDSFVDLTNGGSLGGDYNVFSDVCANVYVVDPAQEVIACCSCMLTPGHLKTLSAKNDLIVNTLTPGVPTGISVQIVATKGPTCNASTVTTSNLVTGLAAWMTTPHQNPAGDYSVTETAFTQATLSADALSKLTTYCAYIQSNGSGYGICKACRQGAQGSGKQ